MLWLRLRLWRGSCGRLLVGCVVVVAHAAAQVLLGLGFGHGLLLFFF